MGDQRYQPYGNAGKLPVDCCDFSVVDMDSGKEVCRCWTLKDAQHIAFAMTVMASESKDAGHKSFWINGHTDPIHFNEGFQLKALTVAKKRAYEENPTVWHNGKAVGEVIGALRRIDDLDVENEVVIVPKTGAAMITCTFPDSMRDEIGKFWGKTVKVRGVLTYEDHSPHPQKVKIKEGGVEAYPNTDQPVSFRDLQGLFADRPKMEVEWDTLLNV